jgi:hypothetical protein
MPKLRILAAIALLICSNAHAAGSTVLIQLTAEGRYRLWYSEGATNLNDEELTTLSASATPQGGEPIRVAAGIARAYDTDKGVVVRIPEAATDSQLLIDRDDCGGVRVWHSDGATVLTEDQLTELVLTAMPAGGKRLTVAGGYAKAFSTRIGVVALIWQPAPPRR